MGATSVLAMRSVAARQMHMTWPQGARWWRGIAAALLATACLVYLVWSIHLLNARASHQIEVTGHQFVISDLFPRWLGSKALLAGQDPYSPAFTAELHRQYYGRVMAPEEEMHLFRNVAEFFYPPYVALQLLPLLWLPFELVRWLATALLALAVVASAWTWARVVGVRSHPGLIAAAAGALLFFPTLDLLILQQLTGVVLLELVGAYALIARGRLTFGGLLLGLSLVKPQSAVIPVAALLFWALWRRERWGIIAGLGVTCGVQLAFSWLLVPGWVGEFVSATLRYQRYNVVGFWLPGQLLGSNALGAALIAAPLALVLGWQWWRARGLQASSAPMIRLMALTFAASLLLMPDISYYNKVFLIPLLVTILAERRTETPLGRLAWRLTVAFGITPIALVTVAASVGWIGLMLALPLASALLTIAGVTIQTMAIFAPLVVVLAALPSCLMARDTQCATPKAQQPARQSAPRAMVRRSRLLMIAAWLLPLAWLGAVVLVWRQRGLFDWLGIDYGFFWAAAQAYMHSGPLAMFDLDAIRREIQPLSAWYGPLSEPLKVGPTPYPLLALAFVPLTWLSPPVGLGLWSAINLAVAFVVVRGLAARFATSARWSLVVVILCFMPLAYTVVVGQPTILLMYAFYRAYLAFERGDDVHAGAWSGVLLLKPQYAVFLLGVLVYRRRWGALAGAAAVGAALLLAMVAMLGVQGMFAYIGSLKYASGFRAVDPIVYPEQMISWRGVLASWLPATTSESTGVVITALLSAMTAATLLPIWRGPWNPTDNRFPRRMLATLLVTMLASFHNHIHGAALLVVPALVFAATDRGPRHAHAAMRLGLFLPTVLFTLTTSTLLAAWTLVILMLVALGAITFAELTEVPAGDTTQERRLVPALRGSRWAA